MSAVPASRAAASAAPMLDIGELHVAYGQVEAVRGVSLALMPGQIVSVIGPNGAGKTTLLAAAMGLLPSRGRLFFEGEPLAGLDVEARVERGLTLVPEQRELFGALSVADNLLLGAYARRIGRAERARAIDAVFARFPRLADRRAQVASTLSGGERQSALGRALMSSRLLMLDEPTRPRAADRARDPFDRVRALRRASRSCSSSRTRAARDLRPRRARDRRSRSPARRPRSQPACRRPLGGGTTRGGRCA
jgi:branched-chain amino acid transport system ATP-binding protein